MRLRHQQILIQDRQHDMEPWIFERKSRHIHDEYKKLGCYRELPHILLNNK
jgi:hypothetical protein